MTNREREMKDNLPERKATTGTKDRGERRREK
jgi:hypothetical protein